VRNRTSFRLAIAGVLTLFFFTPSSSSAQITSVQTLEFDKGELTFEKVRGYDIVELDGCDFLTEVGKPMLPSKEVRVALPAGMAAKTVRVLDTRSEMLSGEYVVFPAQPPRRLDHSDGEVDFVEPDCEIYASTHPYPPNSVELIHQTDLAGQGIAVIRINPVQYVPARCKLRLYTSVSFVIEGAGGYECGDYLPASISGNGRKMYERMLQDMVINPGEVELLVGDPPSSSGVEPGDYSYVIVTLRGTEGYFQPLADWKTKKGIPATIVDTYWIRHNGGYGGSYVEQIRAFIIDAHNTWGAAYFLLGGDTGWIPYHTRRILETDIPNDTYYSDFDDDWTCEVHVGRASVTNPSEISTFVDKVLTYEKNPPLTGYAKRAALLGFDLYEFQSGEGENCKKDIDILYIPSHWDVTKVYDSHGGNHRDSAIAAVNAGHHLVNHIDHCGESVICTGTVNHGWGLYKADVDAFYNGDKQGIFYSIGCWPCAYDYPDCIAEHWVRNPDGGGVAFVGNSRTGWYTPYSDMSGSLLYDRNFFRSLFEQRHLMLGECFSNHKNISPKTDDYYKYIFTELTLLGDPELPIWIENPRSFEVSHPSTLPTGPSSFTVHVDELGGSNVGHAYVCLWKGEEVYLTGHTDFYGNVTFEPSPTTSGTMHVTANRYDFLPSETEAEVTSGGTVTLQCQALTPTFCRGKNLYFKLTVVNSSGGNISGTLSFAGYSGHDCDPANELVRIPRERSYAEGTSEEWYFFKTPGAISPGPYSASVSGSLSGWDLSCCMDFDIIQCEPWRSGDNTVWELVEVDRPELESSLPASTSLSQNYPNPFNAETNIGFALAEEGNVTLVVYDLAGRLVATLVDGYDQAGEHTVTWDASDVSSGIYFYKLTAGDYTETKRMMLVK